MSGALHNQICIAEGFQATQFWIPVSRLQSTAWEGCLTEIQPSMEARWVGVNVLLLIVKSFFTEDNGTRFASWA